MAMTQPPLKGPGGAESPHGAALTTPLELIPTWKDVWRQSHLVPDLAQLDHRVTSAIGKVAWADLAQSERILLRFAWECVYRTPCPYPFRPY